jgi:hypothetical protein
MCTTPWPSWKRLPEKLEPSHQRGDTWFAPMPLSLSPADPSTPPSPHLMPLPLFMLRHHAMQQSCESMIQSRCCSDSGAVPQACRPRLDACLNNFGSSCGRLNRNFRGDTSKKDIGDGGVQKHCCQMLWCRDGLPTRCEPGRTAAW